MFTLFTTIVSFLTAGIPKVLDFSEEQHVIDWIRSRGGTHGLSDEYILNESFNEEEYYYTEWEEIDDDVYYDEDGNEYEL